MPQRRCVVCRVLKNREELIKITKIAQNLVISPDTSTFGRSAYLCYNEKCIEDSFKKNKLAKALKTSISDELKGQLLNELRNSQNK